MLGFCSRYRRTRCLLVWVVITALLLALVGCSDSSSSSQRKPDFGDSAGASVASAILKALATGAVSYVGGKSMGWIFSLLKSGDSDTAQFTYMEDQLDTIIQDLEIISGELKDLFSELNIVKNELELLMTELSVTDDVNTIENDYENINGIPKTEVGTALGQSNAETYATAILGSDNIDQRQYNVYKGMIGPDTGVAGILESYTTNLLSNLTGGGTALRPYISLETVFKHFLEIQLKAATLMCEALHWQQDPWVGSSTTATANSAQVGRVPTVYSGTAADWMKKFQGQLNDEVQEFLRCTDRIVLSQADLRTDLSTSSSTVASFLPSDADIVYARADFIAAQMSTAHNFGLNVRLVGEPDEIQDLVKNYHVQDGFSSGATNNMTQVALTDLDDPGNGVNLSLVEVWYNWPTDAMQAYAQWKWDTPSVPSMPAGHIRFDLATHVAVAKYEDQDPFLMPNTVVKTTYPHEEASYDSGSNLIVGWYDDDMNQVTAETDGAHEFGHVLLAIRHRPESWYQDEASSYAYLDGYYNLTTDAGTTPGLWCLAAGQLHKGTSTVENYFAVKSGIGVPIVNGSGATRTISVTGSLATTATDTCTDSGGTVNTAQVGFFFDKDTSGAYKWWDITTGTGHIYDSATISYDLQPANIALFTIMANVEVDTLNCGKGDEYSVKAYPVPEGSLPGRLYLFFN
jgi:hypothetical protein